MHVATVIKREERSYSSSSSRINNMDGNNKVLGGVGGGGGRVGIGHHEDDIGDGLMHCIDHPYSNSTAGGICAVCLQEKLGKLVSSSSPLRGPSSSSSTTSPSFRSDIAAVASAAGSGGVGGSSSSLSAVRPTTNTNGVGSDSCQYYTRRSRIPYFLLAKKKKATATSADRTAEIVFKRSKSTTATRSSSTRHRHDHSNNSNFLDDLTPRKRFWSFLYHHSKSTTSASSSSTTSTKQKEKCLLQQTASASSSLMEDETPPAPVSLDRKVSRSRSVGCGSRSFSGDFFERISTRFGDCTLRRVESQREGKSKSTNRSSSMKEKVKCGGFFGGFTINSTEEQHNNSTKSSSGFINSHGRNIKNWSGWAFASPMRAFGGGGYGGGKAKDAGGGGGKRVINIRESSSKNTAATPNLLAVSSILAVRG